MNSTNIDDLQTQLQHLYHSGDYREALVLAADGLERFPDHSMLLYYWQITMAARLGNNSQAIVLLRQALTSGGWFGEVLLRQSPSLKALQGSDEFEQLVMLNRELQERDQDRLFPVLTLRSKGQCQAGGVPCALLLALHANGSTAQETVPFWRPAASAGWLVAIPQSSQPMWKNAYIWDDREFTAEEISRHFSTLCKQYSIDQERVVVAGHSMGGEMAIWLALSAAIPAGGFIAFGPGGPFMDDLDNWKPLIQANQDSAMRGYLVIGQEDQTIPSGNVRRLARMLNEAGISCHLEVIPDVGHDFSVEYEASLLRGLDYIQGSSLG
jgi:predicted esterase